MKKNGDLGASNAVRPGSREFGELERGPAMTVRTPPFTRETQHRRAARPTELEFQWRMLDGVSRTFALTIPELPQPLRTVVGNAYLLCRIADTIEDSPTLSIEEKRDFYGRFLKLLETDAQDDRLGPDLASRLPDALDAERELVQNVDCVVQLARTFKPEERAALTRCVRVMSQGMEEFQEGRFSHGLRDMAHLDAYCYHVAGVVGEMLCDLFCAYSPEAARHCDELTRLARSFGQGLQMTNILKDIWDDRTRNVCWLPQEVFARHGYDLRDLRPSDLNAAYRSALRELIGVARGHLENALRYSLLIPKREPGIRMFCLWAIAMAVLTLRRINANPTFTTGEQVKISRRSVRFAYLTVRWFAANDTILRGLFRVACAGLPKRPKRRGAP
jgi:farnesyl-diphosphate farnesyltransferase